MLQKTLSVLKGFQADKGVSLSFSSMGKLQKRPDMKEITIQERKGAVSGQVAPSITEEKLQEIHKKLEEEGVQADLEVPLQIGGPFSNYGEIDNVLDEGKTVLAHKPGEVLLVDVWATWCGPCQKPMTHNQQMLEQYNQKWKDRVRIVGVSVDESKEKIKARVQQKGWNKITHLTLLGWKGDHNLIKDFKIQGIPFVCLVDKFGKVNYVGHPMQIKLEKRINELLEAGEEKNEKKQVVVQKEEKKQASEEEINKLISNFTKEKIEEVFKEVELFCFTYSWKRSYKDGKFNSHLTIKAFVMDGEVGAEEKAKAFFGNQPGVEVKLDTVKYMKIPYLESPKCWKCEAPLEFPYFWLRWEGEGLYGCRKCVEGKSEQEGHHFTYEKNSILLLGKWESVSVKKMGDNLQPQDVTKVEDSNQFLCNICRKVPGKVEEARYISLGCRPDPNFFGDHIDVCEPCMDLTIKGDEKALEGLKPDGHLPHHPFLRILYHTKDYYTY